MNEAEPTGVYNEQPDRIYWASKKYEYNDYTNGKNVVVKLSNGEDKGYQYSFNAILTKKYDFGFTGSIGYTYTMAKDLTANPGSFNEFTATLFCHAELGADPGFAVRSLAIV